MSAIKRMSPNPLVNADVPATSIHTRAPQWWHAGYL